MVRPWIQDPPLHEFMSFLTALDMIFLVDGQDIHVVMSIYGHMRPESVNDMLASRARAQTRLLVVSLACLVCVMNFFLFANVRCYATMPVLFGLRCHAGSMASGVSVPRSWSVGGGRTDMFYG